MYGSCTVGSGAGRMTKQSCSACLCLLAIRVAGCQGRWLRSSAVVIMQLDRLPDVARIAATALDVRLSWGW